MTEERMNKFERFQDINERSKKLNAISMSYVQKTDLSKETKKESEDVTVRDKVDYIIHSHDGKRQRGLTTGVRDAGPPVESETRGPWKYYT